MARKVEHALLNKAKKNKNDEFYTQLIDIESELKHYKAHFKNKVIFCNCDDARISNFVKYFINHFEEFKIKKLIAVGYKKNNLQKHADNESEKGTHFTYSQTNKDCKIDYLTSDGDFRSKESIALLEEADIVITNPPFSLFREYLAQLMYYNKKFLIISNINAITYKETFKFIQENRLWLGINLGRGISGFIVPEHYELYGTETKIDCNGNKIISPNNCLWLTNLDNFKRNEDIPLYNKYYGNEIAYPMYDNYNGININKTKDIPMDYTGYMGVPITFLHKFNPKQFEIIKFRKGDDEKDLSIQGKCPYFRILIKNKRLNA